jgi:hypothetical protein
MNTGDLIEALARGAGPAPRAVAARRLWPIAVVGAALAAWLAHLVLGWVDPRAVGAALWVKLVYGGALAAAAGWLAAKLARPVARQGAARAALVTVVVAMALLGAAAWSLQPAPERGAYLMGHSWATCPWAVFALSLPTLAAALAAVRSLAPTRPVAAGAACGLFAGAVGAMGYAFACTEVSVAFIALWYSLGIAMSAGLGALLGPRVLRW